LNLPYFIAKRISNPEGKSFSSVIHKIAIASVALGIAIMLVTFMILGGFQENIKDKVYSFSGHLQVKKFSLSNSFEEKPIVLEDARREAIESDPYIDFIQEFAHKPGLLTKNDEVFGMLYKGVAASFNKEAFEPYLLKGEFLEFNDSTFTRDVLISQRMAENIGIDVGDRIVAYFIMDPPRTRGLTVKGIFNTALDNFDENIIIGDIKMIRGLNGWQPDEVGGFEVFVKDVEDIEAADNSLMNKLSVEQYTERVDDKFVQIFDWLNLLSQNVSIFIWLILIVACFNMVSVIFILVMERTQMIGVFKALGATDRQIRKIFSYNGIRLVIKGLLLGNAIALVFGLLQYYLKLIPLDPQNYYMEYVPIDWDLGITLGLNVLCLVIISVVLFLPTAIIARIRPVKAIRFD
jgi:lipoprotein-releasing system permease protein